MPEDTLNGGAEIDARLYALEARVTALENDSPEPEPDAIPELAAWESNMVVVGAAAAEYLKAPHTDDELLNSVYYDQDRVFHQISEYVNDEGWMADAARARQVYHDYLVRNNWGASGYRNFTTGFRMFYNETGDEEARLDVVNLSHRAAYTPDSTDPEWTVDMAKSREVAYAIVSYIDAEAVGEPRRDRRTLLVDQAYGHVAQFVSAFKSEGTSEANPQPFMTGLTAHALIRSNETEFDERCYDALAGLADVMWEKCWVAEREAFWYDELNRAPAPDLNLLIAPLYAWLWLQSGDDKYREQGDKIFAGGVRHAYLGAPNSGWKQFNQNYWWSFDYVKWRSQG